MSAANSTAKITIVIPVYNRADIVGRTLDSIAAQTARPLDIILVDNNSTDNTDRVLQQWKDRTESESLHIKILTEKQPGAAAARNCGLEAVGTEWVMFFDSDDTMSPVHVARALLVIADNPDADIVGWDVMFHELNGKSSLKRFHSSDCQWNSLMQGSMATLRWCARTALVRRAGGWNPQVRFWDDIELGARMLAINPKVVHVGKGTTVDVYESAECISRTTYLPTLPLMETALQSIEHTLPADKRHWCELKRVIQAGNAAAENYAAARATLDAVIARTSSLRRRILWRAVFTYTRLGGRGAARIARLLL